MNEINLKAYAKINIGLDVKEKRDDGYHEVKMVMDSVDLFDNVNIIKNPGNEVILETDDKDLPVDERNLAVKAAKAFIEYVRKKDDNITDFGIKMMINKNIPKEAGLAGGSTDAAAVIKGMDRLFNTGLSLEELCDIGAGIGSDVPYCIMGGCALALGRGEVLKTIEDMPDYYAVIVKTKEGVSTGQAYAEMDMLNNRKHPDIDALVERIRDKASLKEIAEYMENSFEEVIFKKLPKLKEIADDLEAGGAVKAMMSGSGPSIFGLFENKEDALRCFNYMTDKYDDAESFPVRRVR